MESVSVLINKPDEFDRAVHGDDKIPALPSGNVIQIITKDGGMVGGRACCVITFEAEVDGKIRRAQFSTSVRLLKQALRLIDAGYTDDGWPVPGTFGR